MSYGSRKKAKGQMDVFMGILLAFIGLLALAALAGGVWWVRSHSVVIDEATNCPKDGPRGVHVLLFDQTDPICEQQALQVKQRVRLLADNAIMGGRFDLYTIEGNSQKLLNPVLQICSPGKGKDASILYENPEQIQDRFEHRFIEVLDGTLGDLLRATSRQNSPIIESMRAAAIESFGSFQQTKEHPFSMTIISDMVQHSPLYSHIRSAPNFGDLSRSPTWRSLQPDLRGSRVEIVYLLRSSAVRAGKPIQNRGQQLFWEELIAASNGRPGAMDPI
jgi:hypothetical protein